jgi:hypothetical protein
MRTYDNERVKRYINTRNGTLIARGSYVTMAFLTGYYAMAKLIYNENAIEDENTRKLQLYFRHHDLDSYKTLTYVAYYI